MQVGGVSKKSKDFNELAIYFNPCNYKSERFGIRVTDDCNWSFEAQ